MQEEELLRKGTQISDTQMNVVFKAGGLGDNICRLPAVKYMVEQWPWVKPDLWVPDYFVELAEHTLLSNADRIRVRPFSDFVNRVQEDIPSRVTEEVMHTTLGTHLLDHAFRTLVDRDAPKDKREYLKLDLDRIDISSFDLPKEYVVMTTAYTAPVREFMPKHINEVVKGVKAKGLDVVFLGQRKTKQGLKDTQDIQGHLRQDTDYSQGLNLIDKTGLLEAGKIMAQARAVIGLDNGLLHLAGMSDVPIVAGYTTLEPELRLPLRSEGVTEIVTPSESLACRFCQSRTNFIYSQDFKYCMYDRQGAPKQYKYACIKEMNANKWLKALERVL